MPPKKVNGLAEQAALFSSWHHLTLVGFPIFGSIDVLRKEFPKYEKELKNVKNEIANGKDFSPSFSNKSFHRIVKHLTQSGEKSGCLDKSMEMISQYLSKDIDFRRLGISDKLREEVLFYEGLTYYIESGAELTGDLMATFSHNNFLPPKIKQKLFLDYDGKSLSKAMENNKPYFPLVVIKTIDRGERRGVLNTELKEVVGYLERKVFMDKNTRDESILYDSMARLFEDNLVTRGVFSFAAHYSGYPPPKVLGNMLSGMDATRSLADVMEENKRYFSRPAIEILRSADTAGTLDDGLKRASNYLETKSRVFYK